MFKVKIEKSSYFITPKKFKPITKVQEGVFVLQSYLRKGFSTYKLWMDIFSIDFLKMF